jgi:hypothetical protein
MLGPRQRERDMSSRTLSAALRRYSWSRPKKLNVCLDDRPGTLAKATGAIANAGINIEVYCAVPQGQEGEGAFRVVTRDLRARARH